MSTQEDIFFDDTADWTKEKATRALKWGAKHGCTTAYVAAIKELNELHEIKKTRDDSEETTHITYEVIKKTN